MNKDEAHKYIEQMAYERRLEYTKKHPKRNKDYAKMAEELEGKATNENNRRLKAERKRKLVKV
jgi:hypothetical protein